MSRDNGNSEVPPEVIQARESIETGKGNHNYPPTKIDYRTREFKNNYGEVIGPEFEDPFGWMKEKQKNPDTGEEGSTTELTEWANQQAAFTEQYFHNEDNIRPELAPKVFQAETEALEEKWVRSGKKVFVGEMGLQEVKQPGVERNKLYATVRNESGEEETRVILDANNKEEFGAQYSMFVMSWTPDNEGKEISYTFLRDGDEKNVETRFRNIATGKDRIIEGSDGEQVDRIIGARYGELTKGSYKGKSGYYYARVPRVGEKIDIKERDKDGALVDVKDYEVKPGDDQYFEALWFHEEGTDPSQDSFLHRRGIKTDEYVFEPSRNERFMGLTVRDLVNDDTDVSLFDKEKGEMINLIEGQGRARKYHMQVLEDRMLLWEDKGRGLVRQMMLDEESLDKIPKNPEEWPVIIPEDETGVLESIEVTPNGTILGKYMVEGHKLQLRRYKPDEQGGYEMEVKHEQPFHRFVGEKPEGYILPPNGKMAGSKVGYLMEGYFGSQQGVYDEATDSFELTGKPELIANPDDYILERTNIPSKDGQVNVGTTIIRHKDVDLTSGDNPSLYEAYGFGVPRYPKVMVETLSLLDRGVVIYDIGARGGHDEGEEWEMAGSGENKIKTREDADAVIEHSINQGYTNPSKTAKMGESNGGFFASDGYPTEVVVLINADISWGEVDDNQLAGYWRKHVGNWDDPKQRARLREWSDYEQRIKAIKNNERRPRPRKALLSVAMEDRRVEPHNSTRWGALRQHEETLYGLGKEHLTLVKPEGGGHAGKSLKELGGRDAFIKSFLGNALGIRAERLPTTPV